MRAKERTIERIIVSNIVAIDSNDMIQASTPYQDMSKTVQSNTEVRSFACHARLMQHTYGMPELARTSSQYHLRCMVRNRLLANASHVYQNLVFTAVIMRNYQLTLVSILSSDGKNMNPLGVNDRSTWSQQVKMLSAWIRPLLMLCACGYWSKLLALRDLYWSIWSDWACKRSFELSWLIRT